MLTENETLMNAMVLKAPNTDLVYMKVTKPVPQKNQVLIKVSACGVCRTDLHIVDGELTEPKLPLILGHQVIGEVVGIGKEVKNVFIGQKVGVPWLGSTCNQCQFCLEGRENLCEKARFTGYQINGGFAQYCVADARYALAVPHSYCDIELAPLLCAGLIGYRAFLKTKNAHNIGIYGFGSAAHIITQVAKFQNKNIYAFTAKGDKNAQDFAYKLGASWAGGSDENAPLLLDGIIIFAPVGELVVRALNNLQKGGTIVCAGIHMSDIPAFSYDLIWQERSICSVANLTRKDGIEFLNYAPKIPVKTEVHTYPLTEANEALNDLRHGKFNGSFVIKI